MRRPLTILSLAATAALAGCASMQVGADFDPAVSFQTYATYDWAPRDTLPTGDPRLDANPFFDARLREAVDNQLALKGLRRSSNSPEILVHYHAAVRDRIDAVRVDESRGYVTGEAGRETYVYEEGTLLVDIAEARGKRVVWRGWARMDLDELLTEPSKMAETLAQAARRMFERFPRNGGAKPVAP